MKRELLAVDVAARIVLDGVSALEPELVPLEESGGRHTVVDVKSQVDLPGFDNSVMDGYALIAADTSKATADSPVELDLVGESRAGNPFAGELVTGQACGISTGAMIPEGADAVLQKEMVKVIGERIRIADRVEAGRDIRRRGEVTRAGETVLPASSRIGPVEIGAMAATGTSEVSCHRWPRVSLLTSGDELVEPGQRLGPGQIWNSNQFALTELIRSAPAELVSTEVVPDGLDATVAALDRALSADLTVISGGVSVGRHDHVRPALAKLGVEQDFWGLALKPGRPTWFGRRGDSRVIGVPGNPVSALVVFRMLAMPLLQILAGGPEPGPRPVFRLASPVERLRSRMWAVPCHPAGGGQPDTLEPMPQLGSHDFLSLIGATHLALVEAGTGRVEAGDPVETVSMSAG